MIERKNFDYLYTNEEKSRFAWVREQLPELSYKPLISIVVPVYKTPLRLLDEMIASVENQSYVNWELCIVNASTEEALLADAAAAGTEQNQQVAGQDRQPAENDLLNARRLSARLKEWSEFDLRIRVKDLPSNKGISGNTNEAFEMVQGEFTAMLDHDDLLTEDALSQIAMALNTAPHAGEEDASEGYWDFLYSDQDMIDEDSTHRFNPLYKPAYSRELLYSGNYITHFSVIRTDILRSFGGWDPDTDGAQDWDAFLKTVEHTDKVVGIPLILYHWRMASTSTASSMATKSYALDAQCRSVTNHLHRMGYPNAKADFYNRDVYKMQILWGDDRSANSQVSVIITDDSRKNDLRMNVLMAHAAFKGNEKEIIVLSSDEERLAAVESMKMADTDLPEIKCKCFCAGTADGITGGAGDEGNAGNRGDRFTKLKTAFSMASGEILLFLSDLLIPKRASALTELADWTLYDKIGLVSPTYVTWDDRILEMGKALKETGPIAMFEGEFADGTTNAGKCYWYRNIHACSPDCFAIRKDAANAVINEIPFTEKASWMDFCLRLESRGYHNMVTPYAKMVGSPAALFAEEAAYAGTFRAYELEPSDHFYRR